MAVDKQHSEQGSDMPKVGVPLSSSPDALLEPHTDDESSWWATRNKTQGLDPASPPQNRKWKSVTSEEMERFRPVPVVGRLPWRWQYMTFVGLLLVSLVSLLWISSSLLKNSAGPEPGAVRQGMDVLEQSLAQGLSGQKVDPAPQAQTIATISQASQSIGGSVQTAWKGLEPVLKEVPQYQTDAVLVVSSARQLSSMTSETLNKIMPFWRQAGQGGEWESVDAVNFAQALAEMQYIQDLSTRVAQGKSDIPSRLNVARQNIDQAIRVFASSDAARQNTNLTQSWRALAAGFLAMRPHLDALMGRSASWNNYLGVVEVFKQRKSSVLNALGPASSAAVTPTSKRNLWISGALVIVSLVFLLWISWKQQRWHVLDARSSFDVLQQGVDDMSRQVRQVSTGNLSVKVRPSDANFQPMADAFNNTLKRLRNLVVDVQQTAQEASVAATRATDTTGVLVENSRQQIDSFSSNVENILEITSSMQDIAEWSTDADTLSDLTLESVSEGQRAVEDAADHIRVIREKSDDAMSRAQRLHRSSTEIQFMTSLLNEISDQMGILAIQAAIQATKAGEAGQGFRVVADALKSLSEKSGEGSRRVGSLIENNLADVVALEDSLLSITQKTDEGSRLSDVSMESTLMVREKLMQLKESVEKIRVSSTEQGQVAEQLSESTNNGMKNVEAQSQIAQDAADAVLSLIESFNRLNDSALKFKV